VLLLRLKGMKNALTKEIALLLLQYLHSQLLLKLSTMGSGKDSLANLVVMAFIN